MTRAEAIKKIRARKWNGDDSHSWAVFIPGQGEPFVSGLTRTEVNYYKTQAADILVRRAART
jgi:hypothetical protein